MPSPEESAIDSFLATVSQAKARGFTRHWQTFMAYCMILQARAFHLRGFSIQPANCSGGFKFNLSPAGKAANHSFFELRKPGESMDLMMNVYARRMHPYWSMRLCLDLAVIAPGAIHPLYNTVESDWSAGRLYSYTECKHQDGYQELVATLEGITWNLQKERLYSTAGRRKAGASDFRIPSVLMISGTASRLASEDADFRSNGSQLRIFGDLRPGTAGETGFLNGWY